LRSEELEHQPINIAFVCAAGMTRAKTKKKTKSDCRLRAGRITENATHLTGLSTEVPNLLKLLKLLKLHALLFLMTAMGAQSGKLGQAGISAKCGIGANKWECHHGRPLVY